MDEQGAVLRKHIDEGRRSVASLGSALVEYLATISRVAESGSQAGSRYEEIVAIADTALSAEIGTKLRESINQFANGSVAMASAFSEIMRTMKDAYDRIEATIPDE